MSDLEDTVVLLKHTLNISTTQNLKVTEEAVKCFQVICTVDHSWTLLILYMQ
jgi:hypothetical protein